MEKRLENTIILTRMDEPIDESNLRPNEHRVKEYWKVSYNGLSLTEHPKGEMQRYLEVIEGINSTRGKEPKKIIIFE